MELYPQIIQSAASQVKLLFIIKEQYFYSGACLVCHGKIYNGGQSCCPQDSYLDYSVSNAVNCVPIGTTSCSTVSISINSLFKVCCPSGQYYNLDLDGCASATGNNCDLILKFCCYGSRMMEYFQMTESYACVDSCSWKSSSISLFRC